MDNHQPLVHVDPCIFPPTNRLHFRHEVKRISLYHGRVSPRVREDELDLVVLEEGERKGR